MIFSSGCSNNNECIAPAKCLNGTCLVKLGDYGACTANRECEKGSCQNGWCGLPLGSSGCSVDGHCFSGACSNGVCIVNTGQPCVGGVTCKGICNNKGICVLPNGSPCNGDNTTCYSNYCHPDTKTCKVYPGTLGCNNSTDCIMSASCVNSKCLLRTGIFEFMNRASLFEIKYVYFWFMRKERK